MKQASSRASLVIHILLGLGLLALGFLVGLAVWLLTYFAASQYALPPISDLPVSARSIHSGTPVIPPGQLGALGVACGGPERFPCMPGSVCSVVSSLWGSAYGTCVRDTRQVFVSGGPGDACDAVHGCRPGLSCLTNGPEAGTCQGVPTNQ